MQNDAAADEDFAVDGDVGVEDGAGSDSGVVANGASGSDGDAFGEVDSGADVGERADGDSGGADDARSEDGAGMDSGRRFAAWMNFGDRAGDGSAGVGGADDGAAFAVGEIRWDEEASGAGFGGLTQGAHAADERKIFGTGVLKGGDLTNFALAVAFPSGAKPFR